MPVPTAAATKKRKSARDSGSSSKRRAVADHEPANATAEIQQLEDQISESRKHYNNIATLIGMLNADGEGRPNLAVAVALCRVFSRLIAAGDLGEINRASENERLIAAWLKERLREYQNALASIIRGGDSASQVGDHPWLSGISLTDRA